MKTTYIAPHVQVVKLNPTQIIALSDSLGFANQSAVDAGVTEADTRSTLRYNVWDDDWSAE
jgi:hypothetical protein